MDVAAESEVQPASARVRGEVTLLSRARKPVLELIDEAERSVRVPFEEVAAGRTEGERRWLAQPSLPARGPWRFRICLGKDVFDAPTDRPFYETRLRSFWLQDKQLYAYEPAPYVSPSRVVKIAKFRGSLPARALYVYLPRGYDEHGDRQYPVLYMHDGQNVFETFVEDSYAGSWRADEVADRAIAWGLMRECIIVGVSNGGERRLTEYLPPYSSFAPKRSKIKPRTITRELAEEAPERFHGEADKVFAYYRDEVGLYLQETYRPLEGREHRATCGSSMGGVFSAYIAWEHPEFARHHALMSGSFWITRNGKGRSEMLERFRNGEPRDLRLWLDSGTGKPDTNSDDNMASTERAYKALRANGYRQGPDFQYFVDEGAIHHESAWAARLDKVFGFLLPVDSDPGVQG